MFQGNVPSSMMQQRDTGNYPQHPASAFPFGPPGAHGPPSGHLYHPGLDIASRYSTHFRNSSDYATPYSRTGFSHSHSDFSLPGSDAFYGGGDTSTGNPISKTNINMGNPYYRRMKMGKFYWDDLFKEHRKWNKHGLPCKE